MKRAVLTLLALIAIFFSTIFIAAAMAHGSYTNKRDPVMGSCCDGYDCGVWDVQPGQITPEGDGYRIRLTREQVLRANPGSAITHIDQFFPLFRVIPSDDGNWHICPKYFGDPDNAVRCLMAPPNS